MSDLLLGGAIAGGNTALEGDLEKIFSLDAQFLADAVIMACAMLVLFTLLSFLLFKPARELMAKRKAKIQEELDSAAKDMSEADTIKKEYDSKLLKVDKEAEEILSQSRKKAVKRENEIIDEAKEEAARIIKTANRDAELEKSKMKDEVKQEMIAVATAMAGKFVAESMDENKKNALIDDTLKEMGDGTWQN